MKQLSVTSILNQLRLFVEGKATYEDLKRYVFARYEAEEDFCVSEDADELLAVLAPYLEYEEACGDKLRNVRLNRLVKVLEGSGPSSNPSAAVFALNYDELMGLVSKHKVFVLSRDVLVSEIRKVSVATRIYWTPNQLLPHLPR